MAFLTYRSSSSPTVPTVTSVRGTTGLSNNDIDANFFTLDDTKYDKTGGTISGNVTMISNSVAINATNMSIADNNLSIGAVVAISALTGTINSVALTTTVTMTAPSTTAGLIPGMVLQKTTGTPGVFGTAAVITSVDSLTQITVTTTSANTIGSLSFNSFGVTDVTANGGGITLKGATDKTITWDSTNSNWTSSEHFNIASGKVFKIATTTVLSASTLGSGVTASSLTSVGTLTSLSVTGALTLSNASANSITTNTDGSSLTISTKNSVTASGPGGLLKLIAGSAGSAGTGGYVTIVGGAGGTTSGLGGAISITSGAGTGSGASGALNVGSGTAGVTGASGDISFTSGVGGSTSGSSGTVTISSGSTTNGATGNISILAGAAAIGIGGNVNIAGGENNSATRGGNVNIAGGATWTSTNGVAGYATLRGGISNSTTTSGTGGTVYVSGGSVSAVSAITKIGGSVYIDGGGTGASGTITYGSVYIGNQANGTTYGTANVYIGKGTGTAVYIKPTTVAAGFLKIAADGLVSSDTSTYLTSYTDTLATVTGRGAATATAITITNTTASTTTATGALIVNGGVGVGGNLTVGGNLVVNGVTTSINSTTLTVDDKNIELGSVGSTNFNITGNITAGSAVITAISSTANIIPGSAIVSGSGFAAVTLPAGLTVASVDSATQITVSAVLTGTGTATGAILAFSGATDATANGGGITLKGATDKTIAWDSTNSNWTSSENWNIASGKVFKINNATVLNATTLGSNIVNSSLTKLGTGAGFVKSDASGNLTADTNTYLTSAGDGALTISTVAAALTNNTVTLALSGAYSANTTTARTLDLKVGPALTNLATLMTTAGAGFIRRGATADTYSIDTSTYLTSYTEADTLATVTGRGASTSTAITLNNGTTNLGHATTNYITTSDNGSIIIKTKDQTTRQAGLLNIQTGNTTAAGSWTGGILIKTGDATGGTEAYAGDISIYPGSGDLSGASVNINGGVSAGGVIAVGGAVTIKGGNVTAISTGGTTSGIAGNLYLYGGDVVSASSFAKTSGSVYIEGGGANGLGTITYGSINIGTTSASSSYGTSSVNIGNSLITTTINGTAAFPKGKVSMTGTVGISNAAELTLKSAPTSFSSIRLFTSDPVNGFYGYRAAIQAGDGSGGGFGHGLDFWNGNYIAASIVDRMLGIRTSTPAKPLHVIGDVRFEAFSASYDVIQEFVTTAGTQSIKAGANANTLAFATDSTQRLMLDSNGAAFTGTVTLTTIAATAANALSITGAPSSTTAGTAYAVNITGGTGTDFAVAGKGGAVNITGGRSGNNGTGSGAVMGGVVTITGGAGNTLFNGSAPGGVVIAGGAAQIAGQRGADVSISASSGFSSATNSDGGNLYLSAGAGAGSSGGNGFIQIAAGGTAGGTAAVITFRTSSSERARINSYGLSVGTTADADTVAGAGSILAAGNITAYSDARIKTNIVKIDNALDKVEQLNGYTFDRTDTEGPRQTGVIAQEVLKVLPEAVLGSEDTTYSVAYGNMMGLMIEAIKELNAKVTDLQNQLANK